MMEKGLSWLSLEVSVLVGWLVSVGPVMISRSWQEWVGMEAFTSGPKYETEEGIKSPTTTVSLPSTPPMTQEPLSDPPLSDPPLPRASPHLDRPYTVGVESPAAFMTNSVEEC